MKAPLSWLKEFVDIDISVKELSARLLGAGFEVEGAEEYACFTGVVIGKIAKISPHPDAQKLKVCEINTGARSYTIVTGADNVAEGNYIPAALPGAVLFGGKTIAEAELRGVKSFGMLCSGEELGIDDAVVKGASVNGILILNDCGIKVGDSDLGRDAAEFLGIRDIILDISVLSNRPDCQSIFGISREIGAILGKSVRIPETAYKGSDKKTAVSVAVTVADTQNCPRYMAKAVGGVKIFESPRELRLKLLKCGIRPINNIVDITNIVLLELGQPMHAFDKRNIGGGKIIVRRADKGESITALDGKKYALSPDMLVIADAKSPVAIAGVMGGEYSGIADDTAEVVFEAAKFARGQIRAQSRKLGLRSDSSARFEKGVDITAVPFAIERAAYLVSALMCGLPSADTVDISVDIPSSRVIECGIDRINSLLGIKIGEKVICNTLTSLGLECKVDKGLLHAVVPKFREDIEDYADIAEEVIRMYGYDNIKPAFMDSASITTGGKTNRMISVDRTKSLLTGWGANEIMTYSFISPKSFEMLGTSGEGVITVRNPLSEDYSVMRTGLVYNMLSVIKTNTGRKNDDFRLFESGRVYIADKLPLKKLPKERETLCFSYTGGKLDFYSLKSVADAVLRQYGHTASYERESHPFLHDGVSAGIFAGGVKVGFIGKVHPSVLERFGIESDVLICQIDLEYLLENDVKHIKYAALPKYPGVERDLAVVVNADAETGRMTEAVKAAAELLESITIFDIYKGAQIEAGKMSVALGLVFRSSDRTLGETEINGQMQRVLECLEKKFDAKIRS